MSAYIFLLIIVSCGNGNNTPIEAGNIGLGEEISGSTNVTSESKDTALRICYAYRSKRIGFRSSYLNANFSFSVRNSPCNEEASTKTVSAVLKEVLLSQPMSFDSSERGLTWFSTVNTDIDGNLSGICEKLLKGESTTNEISNTGGTLKVAEFSVGSVSDHYTLLEATQTDSGGYAVQKRTVIYVQTTNQSSPQVGDDYSIEHIESCPEGSANEQFTVEQSTSTYP